MPMNRRSWIAACTSAAIVGLPLAARAQSAAWPAGQTIRFYSPAPPGALSDTIPRLLAQEMGTGLRASVVVENRAGASGSIAAAAAARSPADGNTLFLGTGGIMTINPLLQTGLPYRSESDFQGVGLVAYTPLYLVVRADAPQRSIAELVRAAKAQPGQLAYGSIGTGSTASIAGAMLAKSQGLELIEVPFAGYAPILNELLAGRLAFGWVDGSALARIEQGSLRALAVTTDERASRVPNVPTLKESGVDVDLAVWFGVYTRAGVPPEIAQRLRDELRRATQSEAFRKLLDTAGLEAGKLYGDDFQKYHLAELARWKVLLPALGVKAVG